MIKYITTTVKAFLFALVLLLIPATGLGYTGDNDNDGYNNGRYSRNCEYSYSRHCNDRRRYDRYYYYNNNIRCEHSHGTRNYYGDVRYGYGSHRRHTHYGYGC